MLRALREQVRQLRDYLAKDRLGDLSLADLAFTLQVGRTPLPTRSAFVVGSIDALKVELSRFLTLDTPVARSAASGAGLPADATLHDIAEHWIAGGEVE